MRAILIALNWVFSMAMALSVNTDMTPLWISMLLAAWFLSATALLNIAHGRGWMKSLDKYLDDL
jgi:hypothetical protein